MTGQQSIQLDPLGSSQRILLIAGIIHHHRNIEFLQLLLDFRCVIDHGVFNSKSTTFWQDLLIVRCRIFTSIDDISCFHLLFCCFYIPSVFLLRAETNGVQCINRYKHIHHCRCHQINVGQRLLEHYNILCQIIRCFFSFRNDQVTTIICDGGQCISIIIIVHRKLFCIC